MSQSFAPFYDVNRTYEDNYLQGPFGAFAEVMKGDSAAGASAQSAQTTQSQSSDQAEEFLGFRVNLQCWVKVKADWRDNEFMLNNFGFKQKPNR